MTAIGPYSQSYNFTHMFDMSDLRDCLGEKKPHPPPKSIMGIVANHPDFTIFNYLVNLADLPQLFSECQSDSTVFVPSDVSLRRKGLCDSVITNMDKATARHIVRASTLDRRIPSELLTATQASYWTTRNPYNRLYISTVIEGARDGSKKEKTTLCFDTLNPRNSSPVNLIHTDIEADNGLIHVIDGLLEPLII